MSKRLQKGFTLIEALVVVLILAVVVGIGTPIVANILKDSSTEEFVSNAKLLEDSVSMFYRDNGVMPSKESVQADVIDDMSRKIMLSVLVEEGVPQPESVLDKLITDGKLKYIDYDILKEYTKISESDEGAKNFILVDIVEEDELDESYGVYENDLAGYVFSTESRDKSTGVVYSGAHSITKERGEKLEQDIKDLNEIDNSIFKKGMNPYGFKLVNFTDNKDGTVDLRVTWTNRIVDNKMNLETFKGYTGVDFVVTCNICGSGSEATYDLDKSKDYKATGTTVEQKGNSFIMTIENVPAGKLVMSIKYDKVVYAGKDTGKTTKVGYLNGTASSDFANDLNPEEIILPDGTKCWDLNGDGTPDVCDLDGDGVPDSIYPPKPGLETSNPGDQYPDGYDPNDWENVPGKDTDGDGLPDEWDLDGDGKPDAWDKDEPKNGKPDTWDTDGDGVPDAWEKNPPFNGCPDTWDRDKDGKPDAWDLDKDCRPDAWDTDGDGQPDAWDTDGDGKPDAWDISDPRDGKPDVFDTDGDGMPDTSDKDGDGLPDGKPGNGNGNGEGTEVDLEDEIIGKGEDEGYPVCDTCGIDEIIPDFPIDELYKTRKEVEGFGANNIQAVFEGLKVSNLTVGDYIVLKEYKKSGNVYLIDSNRIRLFKLTDTDVLIPKNPYLQPDFQKNVKSSYVYVIEAYNPKLVNNAGATSPLRAVEIIYE